MRQVINYVEFRINYILDVNTSKTLPLASECRQVRVQGVVGQGVT